jgi:hypothetical protein
MPRLINQTATIAALGRPNVAVNYQYVTGDWDAIAQTWTVTMRAWFNEGSPEASQFQITGLDYVFHGGVSTATAAEVYAGGVQFGSVPSNGIVSITLRSNAASAAIRSGTTRCTINAFSE